MESVQVTQAWQDDLRLHAWRLATGWNAALKRWRPVNVQEVGVRPP